MSERDMRKYIIANLTDLNAISVENLVLPGTPDVNYNKGWIELKWIRAWPSRPQSIVHIKHFTPQQRIWHLKRRLAGGQSWLLLQCRREWLLFDGVVATLNLNTCSYTKLCELTTAYWKQGLNVKEFKKWLLHKQNVFLLTDEDKMKLKKMLQNGVTFPLVDT